MAIKAGQFLTVGNSYVIDRVQTGGVGNVNQPTEKIYELGNYQTVATVRDIPDLSFDVESLDVSTEFECILVGKDPTAITNGQSINFNTSLPIDIISPFKSAQGFFNIVKGIAVPYLTLDSVTYRFGVKANATQSFTLRGDSIYYIPGSPRFQSYAVSGTSYTFLNTAIPYVEGGSTIYALSVCLKNVSTGVSKRLFHGADYTDTSAGFTLAATPDAAYNIIHVTYGTTTVDTYAQSVHQDTTVKPAAVRAKDIDLYVASSHATPTMTRWTGVQSVEISRKVNLENDEEFGNKHYVASSYDTADVTGNIVLKPLDPADLWSKVAQITNTTTNEISGPFTTQPLAMEVRISDPETGTVLKTIYVDDARFTIPGTQGRVQQKVTQTFNFSSDGGDLLVYKGLR